MTPRHYAIYALDGFNGKVHGSELAAKLKWGKDNGYAYVAAFTVDGRTAYRFAEDVKDLTSRISYVEDSVSR